MIENWNNQHTGHDEFEDADEDDCGVDVEAENRQVLPAVAPRPHSDLQEQN